MENENTLIYKNATEIQTKKCIEFREMCLNMQKWITDNTKKWRPQSISLTELETMNMWVNKAIIFSD